ncbi:adenosylcobinamide amidohydrolase [Streptomyces sp. NPDC091266]|uniref:adenosylcobinamide amidohydrolase n=1 Tax=Streptomyces sp. NPDC091266 TaxID=3365978 RepID=UPI0037FDDC55
MISSAVLGGGIGERSWVLNAQVPHGYTRRDPQIHLAEIAAGAGAGAGAGTSTGPAPGAGPVPGPGRGTGGPVGAGVGLMTAADILGTRAHAADEGVEALVTAGIGVSGWAAVPPADALVHQGPGTINTVIALPVALSDAALVNAVATATEAKVQALLDHGHDASGTPTDAVCVAARVPGPGTRVEQFAGPRSLWGARLARAVHRATLRAVTREAELRRGAPPGPGAPREPGAPPAGVAYGAAPSEPAPTTAPA